MSHHHHHHGDTSTGNIKTAFFLNFVFTIIEIIGGLLTNSMAILSDALHDLGDSLSLGLAWFLQKFSKKGTSESFSFGYRRFSLLAALINSIVLIVGSVFIITEAVPRLLNPPEPHAGGMLAVAVLGIIINGAAVFRLKGGDSMNQKVLSWHLLEDVLGWAAVLFVSILMLFFDLPVLDPLASIGITIFILYNVIKNLVQTMKLFLEAVPADVDLKRIIKEINELPGVLSSHHTHLWSLDGENHAFSTHVVVAGDAGKQDICTIKDGVKGALKSIQLEHVTIEVEYEDDPCGLDP
ncbi:cation diffusion facilitator family transporter [Halobacillus litoralis]|uniref:Cation diffusion facilitator family transporter n=1 Tax=Halobacillus litoralis TaxID=45668 RepID=A0A845DXA7_9BACI|nr:cation diffusion facilitator family transporter [Halobacillus litoralis]MYL21718.1 cation diffusion facilitator family transporter [Halobacillus litoralis]